MSMRVVILGGGFGGVYTALGFEKLRNLDLEVTLISRDNFFLFTPMLAEIAAGSIDTRHSVNPIRRMFRRVGFMESEVLSVDFGVRTVSLALPTGDGATIPYDHLVVAFGSVSNSFRIPGVEEYALPLKTLGDAILIRNRVIERLEAAAVTRASRRGHLLTWVVAGGGTAGIELTGELNDYLRAALPSYPSIRPEEARVVLLEAGPRLLPELSAGLGNFAKRKLTERGVEVFLNAPVQGVTRDSLSAGGVGTIHTSNLAWTAGVAPTPFVGTLDTTLEKGRIPTDQCMRVVGKQNVWALGDVARIPDGRGGYYPMTAQHAVREGSRLARNIVAVIRGEEPKPFRYRTLGTMATVGHQSGVAESMGFRFSGFPAWWMWRTYYLLRLPRWEKRIRVLLDWTLDLLFPRDIVQLKLNRSREEEYRNPHGR